MKIIGSFYEAGDACFQLMLPALRRFRANAILLENDWTFFWVGFVSSFVRGELEGMLEERRLR